MNKITRARMVTLFGGTALVFTLIGVGLHATIGEHTNKTAELEACRDTLQNLKAYRRIDSIFHNHNVETKEKSKSD